MRRVARTHHFRRRAVEQVALLDTQPDHATPARITAAKVRQLGETTRAALASGSPEFRRAWLRMFVGRVEVDDDEIRVSGPVSALRTAAATGSGPESAQFRCVWRPVCDEGENRQIVLPTLAAASIIRP